MCITKSIARWLVISLLTASVFVSIGQAQVPVVSVDMDNNVANGIQNVLSVAPGANITVALVLQPGAAGVSSYAVSAQVDNTELAHTGNAELLPAGFAFNFNAGSGGFWPNVTPGVDEIRTFEAGNFGAGPVGGPPLSIGTISFTVNAAVNDGLADIMPGFFNVGIDGMFDNTLPIGQALAPVFNPGYVVPEPGATAAALGGIALLTGIVLRRRNARLS